MKYRFRFLLVVLGCLLFIGMFTGCSSSETTDESSSKKESEAIIDSKIPQMSDEEMDTPLGEGDTGMTPNEVKAITDEILKQEYGIEDFSHYQFNAFSLSGSRGYSATYTLYIQGYPTYERYTVMLTSEGKMNTVNDFQRGKYSCYLKGATEERMAAAVADVERQASRYDEQGPYWLEIDDDGYLCLWLELIVDIPYNENEACGDHKHVFFHSRICEPDA